MRDTRSTMAPCTSLVIATGNQHKFEEFSELLATFKLPLYPLSDFPLVSPVNEDGRTLAENAIKKAVGYARQLGKWVLADDTGLGVDALDGDPGVRSARYAGEQASMPENRQKLLEALQHVPPAERTACFVCQLAVADPTGTVVAQATGRCPGRILDHDSGGPFGFGYDVLFEVADCPGKTLADLPPDQTARLGHRGRAVQELLTAWHRSP